MAEGQVFNYFARVELFKAAFSASSASASKIYGVKYGVSSLALIALDSGKTSMETANWCAVMIL